MRKYSDLALLVLIIGLIAIFVSRIPVKGPPTPALPSGSASPAAPVEVSAQKRDFDIGGIALDMTPSEVTARLGAPRKSDPGYWEYSGEDTARVQTVTYRWKHRIVDSVTGTAVSRGGKVICHTGSTAAEVRDALGGPTEMPKWNKESEYEWKYPQSWGTLEIHMNAKNSAVLHVRLNDRTRQ